MAAKPRRVKASSVRLAALDKTYVKMPIAGTAATSISAVATATRSCCSVKTGVPGKLAGDRAVAR